MPERAERLLENVLGPYYVDSSCIDCDMCRSAAPDMFRREEDLGKSIVYHQPANSDEAARAEEARADCPTDSIGNNGAG